MASTAQKRIWYQDWACHPDRMVRVAFPGNDRDWNLLVADATAPAWEWFAQKMLEHGYLFREAAGGTYNCRDITGGTLLSLHSYGIALDLNPNANPYGQSTRWDFPQAFIDEVLASGLFRWGQTFNDPMHWEIDVPPDQILLPEDPLALLTDDEQQFLKDMIARLRALDPPSSAAFAEYTVRHVRKHPGLTEEDVVGIVEKSQLNVPD